VIGPERKGVLADYLDLNGPVGFILFLIVSLLKRVGAKAIEEGEDSVPVLN
jgi:hypothetical protein